MTFHAVIHELESSPPSTPTVLGDRFDGFKSNKSEYELPPRASLVNDKNHAQLPSSVIGWRLPFAMVFFLILGNYS